VVWFADGQDGGFGGDEGDGDDNVLSIANDESWVESGALSAVTASFFWLRFAAGAARSVTNGCLESLNQLSQLTS
jgi:hypothetical protein